MSLAEESDARKARLLALRRRKEGRNDDQDHVCGFPSFEETNVVFTLITVTNPYFHPEILTHKHVLSGNEQNSMLRWKTRLRKTLLV